MALMASSLPNVSMPFLHRENNLTSSMNSFLVHHSPHSMACHLLQTNLFDRKKTSFSMRASSQVSINPVTSSQDINIEDMPEETEYRKDHNRCLADVWRDIHGQDNWEGLLDPMDPLLRWELIRYGEMAQACYDAFDFDPFSKYCGSSKYDPGEFFDCLGMVDSGYQIKSFLYATSDIHLPNFFKRSNHAETWSESSNWIGYVAISDDETSLKIGRRDVIVAWRGTVTKTEWKADLMDFLIPTSSRGIASSDPFAKVESGFLNLYTSRDETCRFSKFSAREQIVRELRSLIHQYRGEQLSITITGHSLGSALAIINAYDIVELGLNELENGSLVPVCVYSFSGPRVGNERFKKNLEGRGVKVLRVVNIHDQIPKVPGIIVNECTPTVVHKVMEWLPWSYSHVGVELALDHKVSPFLKETSKLSCYHNLEAHLHLLDGYHGKGCRFFLSNGRDPALVNKDSEFLKDYHLIPPYWRQDENKGMVRSEDGRWMRAEKQKSDHHLHHLNHRIKQN